ncbi:MFS transporter [Sphingobium sp. H39-3-25]|uniref:MFS transporter n=1 Tax=Sphingobium arseniciresistens TaxID=3030834 RepID=UPI0023B8FDD3|nr:MFS transporter [Sphingobium arseniciresistens]
MQQLSDPAAPVATKPSGYGKPLFVAILGNVIEYYDATLYGLLAVFLSKAFFAFSDANSALLATYATFIIAYAVRPIAGVLLGHLADIRGHRFVLMLTINLMTIGTVGIGVLPTYATIGVWAPMLLILLRTIQGIGASAEFTVATSYAIEQGPSGRSQYLTGWSNAGANIGPMLASLVSMLLASTFGDAFLSFGGWRVPFLLSAPLGLVVFYLRRQMVSDGLVHSPSMDVRKHARVPLIIALRGHWGTVVSVIAMGAGQRVGTFCIQAYFVTAMIRLGYGGTLAMLVSILLFGIGVPTSVYGGVLADKFGGRCTLVIFFAFYAVAVVPLFYYLGVSVPVTLLGLLVCAVLNNLVAAPLNAAYIMSFPRAVRGAAAALNFNVGSAIIGATAPLTATWLVGRTGSEMAFGWYMSALCMLSCLTAAFAFPRPRMD